MPELPEVETIVRDIRGRLAGDRVLAVEVIRPDILAPGLEPAELHRALRDRRIENVTRRGKNIVLEFAEGTGAEGAEYTGGKHARAKYVRAKHTDRSRDASADEPLRLLINLGMTGRLVAGADHAKADLHHIAARFRLEAAAPLLYDDTRRFGRFELHDPASWEERESELGLEPLEAGFTADALHLLTSRSRTPIRNWLLDQRRVAGVGNIYASEALFRAEIHPERAANSLEEPETGRLRESIRAVLAEAIRARGTTLRDYRDGRGEIGDFAGLLRVYGRENEPCVRCGTSIERGVLGNRSHFHCPTCQH